MLSTTCVEEPEMKRYHTSGVGTAVHLGRRRSRSEFRRGTVGPHAGPIRQRPVFQSLSAGGDPVKEKGRSLAFDFAGRARRLTTSSRSDRNDTFRSTAARQVLHV